MQDRSTDDGNQQRREPEIRTATDRRSVLKGLGALGVTGLGLGGAGTVSAAPYVYPTTDQGGSALEAYYPFDGSTAEDVSQNNGDHDGTVNGATTGESGIGGTNSYDFSGSGQTVEIPDTVSSSSTFTVSLWAKIDQTDQDRAVIGNYDGTTDRSFVIWYDNGNDAWGAGFYDGGHTLLFDSSGPSVGSWQHLAVTFDASGSATLYVDGSSVDSASMSSAVNTTSNLEIGGDFGPHADFDGHIDEVRLYSRELSAIEIGDLYNYASASNYLYPTTDQGGGALQSYYPFEGSSADDVSQNNGDHDGTVNGATTGEPGVESTDAYGFSGSGQTVEITDPISSSSTFTVSLWAKIDQTDQDRAVIGNYDGTTDRSFAIWYDDGNDAWGAAFYDGSTHHLLYDTSTPNVGSWQHLAVTFDASGSATLYVDGAAVDSKSMSSGVNTTSSLEIGGDFGPHADFDGHIDEVRLYSRELSSSEIQDLYAVVSSDATAPSAPSNLASPSKGSTSVDLTWTASSDSGGSGLSHYNVYVDGAQDHQVSASATRTAVDGLSTSTSYDFEVTAEDAAGNESAASSTITITTTSAVTPPDQFSWTWDEDLLIGPSTVSYSPTDEFIFPCIIETSNLTNPLGTYHLYYAPHDAPGGICLAYADSLHGTIGDGTWTEYSSNPVISNNWSPHYSVGHVSSPHALWVDEHGELFLYFHGGNTKTRWATSTDGVNFSYGGVAVTTADMPNASESSYARVFEHSIPDRPDSQQYIMLFMDNQSGTRHIRLATSDDAKNWTIDSDELITPQSKHSGNVSGGRYLEYDNKHFVVFHGSDGSQWVAEVGEFFDQEIHMDEWATPDKSYHDGQLNAFDWITKNGETTMFYDYGPRLSSQITYATTTDLS